MKLKEEKDARGFVRAAIQNDCDKPTASRLLSSAFRAVRADEREKWMESARNSHHFHKCDAMNPCELCRLMNPNWKPTIRGGK